MAGREVEHLALAHGVEVHDQARLVLLPDVLEEAGAAVARVARLHEGRDLAVVLAQVELVLGLPGLDARHQRVVLGGFAHGDAVGLDGGVGDELAAERLHEDGVVARAVDAVGLEVHDGVGAVRGEPALAARHEIAHGLLLLDGGVHVAGVADEEVGGGDGLGVRVVLEHAHAHVAVLVEQLEQLEAGEVDVVPLAAGDEAGVDAGHGNLPCDGRAGRGRESRAVLAARDSHVRGR